MWKKAGERGVQAGVSGWLHRELWTSILSVIKCLQPQLLLLGTPPPEVMSGDVLWTCHTHCKTSNATFSCWNNASVVESQSPIKGIAYAAEKHDLDAMDNLSHFILKSSNFLRVQRIKGFYLY